jgi:biopolymer transport protein ExbD
MKSITAIIIVCLFLTGCGRKETELVKIDINKDGTFLVDDKSSNNAQLDKYITDIAIEQGLDFKIFFIANANTRYSVVEPIVLATAKTHVYLFNFQILGSSKSERCETGGGCRPPNTELSVEIKDNVIYIDNIKKSISEVKELFSSKPDKTIYYLVFISCSGETTFGTFYRFIELCNQSEYSCPVLKL